MGIKSLTAKSDSQLVVNQVNGAYETKVPFLNRYLEKVKMLIVGFDQFKLEKIPKVKNDHVDAL